jgi:transcriptional regulator with XRE-family HTH domain
MLMSDVIDRPAVGTLLRDWRKRRHLSQLDLALEAGVSSRHLSFVETGRSRPSAELVMHLAEQLDVPLRERNGLLLAAGYAPRTASATSRIPRWVRSARRWTASSPATSPTRRWSSTATGGWSPATARWRC